MSNPQIIHTMPELEALDPDALLWTTEGLIEFAGDVAGQDGFPFPAVVMTTGPQVRAARQALKEATE